MGLALDLFCQGMCDRALFFCSAQKFFEKKKSGNTSSNLPRLWCPENQDLSFFTPKLVFQPNFNPKYLKNRDKSIYDLKKPSQKPKSTQAQIFFFMNFKGKKTPNMNFSCQIKVFDTNIIRFGSLYRCQLHVFLSTIGIRRPLSLSLPPLSTRD